MDVAQCAPRTQVAFAIAEQQRPAFGQRQAVADGGHRVLQHAPAPHIHVRIAAGQRGHAHARGQRQQLLQAGLVILLAVQVHRQPHPPGKALLQPLRLRLARLLGRYPQREQPQRLVLPGAQHPLHILA